MVYADSGGTIGWQLVGEVPTRRGGHGLVPRPADLRDSGWDGSVPFEEMPFATNPECGYLATANDPPDWMEEPTSPAPLCPVPGPVSGASRGPGAGRGARESETTAPAPKTPPTSPLPPTPWLGCDFIDAYRARRIRERLAERDSGWTSAECTALQLDLQSIPWREMRNRVLSLTPTSPDARDALNLLGAWDGRVESESPAAAVYELFAAEMCIRVVKARAPNGWRSAAGEGAIGILGHNLFVDRRISHLSRLIREQPPGWFASWSAEMEAALAVVVRKLRRDAGPGPAFWAWGHQRMLRLDHPLFARNRWLGPAFNRGPIPWGGDSNTVSQAATRLADPLGFITNMANLRTVFDLNDLQMSTFVLCGGQSGNPLSPHHADQLPLWQRGDSFVLAWDQAAVIRAAVDTLRLIPPKRGGEPKLPQRLMTGTALLLGMTRETVYSWNGQMLHARYHIYSGAPDQIPPPRLLRPGPNGESIVERIIGHTHPRPVPFQPGWNQPSAADVDYLLRVQVEWQWVYGPLTEMLFPRNRRGSIHVSRDR